MAFDLVPGKLKNLWDSWNLRGVVILSLSLQVFLIFFAPLRKKTRNPVIAFLIWSAYLLADWAAAFAVGLIVSRQEGAGEDVTGDLLVLWAPFLLVHLGGPDTITAFALEDNALWFRHFVGLLFQTAAALYAFLLTFPANELLIPTVLMFVAGLIKYGERTRALYLASMDKLKEFKLGKPTAGPDYEQFMDEYNSRREARIPIQVRVCAYPKKSDLYPEMINPVEDDLKGTVEQNELVNAYSFFCTFKGLVAESTFSINDREESIEFFKSKDAKVVLKVLSAELNFFYEMLFTKSQVVHWKWGHFGRFLCFLCVAASFALFIHEKNTHSFQPLDVTVTYTLILGAIALDIVALIMLVLSDWTAAVMKISMKRSKFAAKLDWLLSPVLRLFLDRKKQRWHATDSGTERGYEVLATPILFRRWSESICAFSLLEFCLKERPQRIPKPKTFCSRVVSTVLSFPSYILEFLMRSLRCYYQALCCCHYSSCILDKILEFFNKVFEGVLRRLGLTEIYLRFRYTGKNPFIDKLWEMIVKQLMKKSSLAFDLKAAKRICEGRGDTVLQSMPEREASVLMPYIEEAEFDQSILLWHIATDLCYYGEDGNRDLTMSDKERVFSKILSDYMLYLLVIQGNMMSGVAGDGQKRFQDTCAEARRFFRWKDIHSGTEKMKYACRELTDVDTHIKPVIIKGDESKSVLFDACSLAKKLRSKRDKWTIMSKVWIEMLCYAASHCRANAHVQTLSKGGELVTFVWLLMVHLGLGDHFQSTKSHGNVKLVISN